MEIDKGYRPIGQGDATTQRLPVQTNEIRAQILDIRRDSVTIRTQTGTVITGRLAEGAVINANIGDTAAFNVGKGTNNETILQVVEISPSQRQESSVREALLTLGLPPNQNNIRLALSLLESGMALSTQNIQNMTQALRQTGEGALDRALFFLENDIPPTQRNVSSLEALIGGGLRISNNIEAVEEALRNVPPSVAEYLADILIRGEAALSQPHLAEHLSLTKTPTSNNIPLTDIWSLFANQNLTTQGMERLAEILKAQNPAQSAQIEAALAARTALPEALTKAAPHISEMLTNLGTSAPQNETIQISTNNMLQNIVAELRNILPQTIAQNIIITPADIQTAVQISYPNNLPQQSLLLHMLGLSPPQSPIVEHNQPNPSAPTTQFTPQSNIDSLIAKLSFAPDTSSLAQLDKLLQDIPKNFELARTVMLRSLLSETAVGSKLFAELSTVIEGLELASQLRDSFYTQIPLSFAGHANLTAELFVFRDKASKRGDRGDISTALVALDTVALGHLETYITKTGKRLNLQFRLESKEVEALLQNSIDQLRSAFLSKGYHIDSVSFKTLQDPFTITSKHEHLTPKEQPHTKRTSFDVRI